MAMDEEAWRVHRAGAPSLDHLRRQTLFTREQVESRACASTEALAILVA